MSSFNITAFWSVMLTTCLKLSAQDPTPTERHFLYGFRVEAFPLPIFNTSTRQASTTQPVADYTYSASSSSQKEALAGTFEYLVNRHISASLEFYLHHAEYVQTAEVRTGLKDPNSGTDTRPVTTYTQTTKANYWVLPFIARYRGIRQSGLFAPAYVLGGIEYRHVGRVRTGTDIVYPDGTTDYNEIPATALRSNQAGVVIGFGYRFFDQIGIKLMPEVRYIRWGGDTFRGPGYASCKNQVEASIGVSF